MAVTHVGDLVELARRENKGLSYPAAVRRAAERGVVISKSRISQAVNGTKTVTPLVVEGISAGFGIPLEDVVRAAIADLGFPIPDFNTSPETAIRRDISLSILARAMLLAALDAARQESTSIVDESELTDFGALRSGEPLISRGEDSQERQ